MPGVRATAFEKIRAGNVAMYYPECNILVSRAADPRSKTPSFKAIPVTLHATVSEPVMPGLPVISRTA
jgi:hypothetical protein